MKKLLTLLLLIPILAQAAITPPPGSNSDIPYNNNGQWGPYKLGNNLSVTTSGSAKYLNSTATGSTSALGTATTANPYITGDFSSGLYTPGAGQVGVEALGTSAMKWTSTGVTIPSTAAKALLGTLTGGGVYNIGIGAGLVLTGTTLASTGGGGSTPTGPAGGDLGGTYPNPTVASILNAIPTPTAYQFLSATTSTSFQWINAASLVDPRTYGAACVGPGYTGGLASSTQGILITNAGTSYTNGTYTAVPLTGGSGSGAQATIIVSGAAITTITITTAGSGYKKRDQLSAASADIGGTGTGFTAQVVHLSANHIPIYDGVHDDTSAFENAFAIAQNTGQGVLVPDGCWVAPTSSFLAIPQGIVMVGEGYSPSYGFNMLSGTASAMPVLYIIGHPTYALKYGTNPNDAFVGFEINASADGQAFSSTVCLGSDVSSGGGSTSTWNHFMSFKGCFAGIGTLNGATLFPHSDHSDYGANNYGMYGNLSDLDSLADIFPSESSAGIHLSGGAGEVRINQDRFEFSTDGIQIADYGGIFISNSQCDHISSTCLRLTSSSHDIMIDNMNFQASGSTATSGNEADITLSRTTSTPVNLSIANSFFTTESQGYPKYAIEVTTTGSFNDVINIDSGSAANNSGGTAYTTDFFNFQNGRPPNIKMDLLGQAIQGKLANGQFGSQSMGLPSSTWSGLFSVGDINTTNNLVIPTTSASSPAYPFQIGRAFGTSPTIFALTGFSDPWDCDIVQQEIFPNINPGLNSNPVVTWLAGIGDPSFGAGSFASHRTDTNSCRLAGLTWMSIPRDYKVYGQASGCVATGTWSKDSSYGGGYGVKSSTNGDSLACTTTTYGGPLYLWYQMTGNNGGTFTYNLDGGSNTTVATQGQNSFTFPISSSSHTVGAVRVPSVSAGSHTINIAVSSTTSASNTVTIEGIGTTPAKPVVGTGPVVFYGNQITDVTQLAGSAAFTADQQMQTQLLQADGLAVNLVNVQNYINNATDYGINGFSGLNNNGQTHIADAFTAYMQGRRNSMNAINPLDYGASCNTLYFPVSFNGTTNFAINTTINSNVISISNYKFQPGNATVNGGGDVGKRICINGRSTGSVGPCTYIASVDTTANTATLGANMEQSISTQGLITGYPLNPNDPSTAQDDTNAIRLASLAAQKGGGKVFLPNHCAVHELKMADTTALEGNEGANYYLIQGLGLDGGSPSGPTGVQAGPTVLYCATDGHPDDAAACIETSGVHNTAYRNFILQGIIFPIPAWLSTTVGIGYGMGSTSSQQLQNEDVLIDHVSFMQLGVDVGEALGYNQDVVFTGQITGTTLNVSAITSTNMSGYASGTIPDFLALGRTITGVGIPSGETITSVPSQPYAGGTLGNFGVSISATTSSETMTAKANTGFMALKEKNSQHLVSVIGLNGDFTDTEIDASTCTGTFMGYCWYFGPNKNGFGNGSGRWIGGRMEEINTAAVVCDGCGLDMTGVDFQFNGGNNIQTINNIPTVSITGGHMYAGGHCAGFNNGMISLGGTNAHVSVDGTILTTNDVGSGCGGSTTYLYITATGNSGATASITGGNNINNETITGLLNPINGSPSKYKQYTIGWPIIDTTQSSLSITSTGGVGIGTANATLGTALDLFSNTATGNSSIGLPKHTTANRPTNVIEGMFGYNTNTHSVEVYNGTSWGAVGGSTVVPFSFGGLTLSNDGGSPNTVIDIAAGGAASDDLTTQMTLGSAVTKTTGAFTAGSGNGCLDTGAVASGTFYHDYLIENTGTITVDILCSTSATTPTLPSGFTVKRRAGSFATDGSSHIISFAQVGSIYYWATPTLDVTTTSLGTSAALETLNVPPGIKTTPLCEISIANSLASTTTPVSVYLSSPDETDLAPTTTSPFAAVPGYSYLAVTTTGAPANAACPFMTTNTTQQIRARASAPNTSLSIITRGWID